MAAEVDRCTAWRRSFMPHQPSLGGKLNHLCQGYHDELVTDMGESKWRKVLPSEPNVRCCLCLLLCLTCFTFKNAAHET